MAVAPSFNETYIIGLQTKELRQLILKEYKINEKRADQERLQFLQSFEKHLMTYETNKITLHQDTKRGILRETKNRKEQERLQKQRIANPEKYHAKTSSTSFQIFNEYLKRLEKFGWIRRKNGICSLDMKHNFLLFKLRQKDLIMTTGVNNTIFHSSTAYTYTYYIPKIEIDYLNSNVHNLQQRLTIIENHLKEAQNEWLGILSEARNKYLKDIWITEFLENRNISPLAKFDFSIEIILDKQILELYDDAPPNTTIKRQWDALIKIKNKALTQYIQREYPALDSSSIERFKESLKNEKQMKKKLFEKIKQKIKRYNRPHILEHLIVLDFLAISRYKYTEMINKGAIQSTVFDRNKPIREICKELRESSRGVYQYDPCEYRKDFDEQQKNQLDEKTIVYLPFFEEFFSGFESELETLWVKKKGINRLKIFFDSLNKTAVVFAIPPLPYNPDDLL